MSSPADKALQLLRYLPRVSLNNLVRNPYKKPKVRPKRGQYAERQRSKIPATGKYSTLRHRYVPVGYEEGKTPFVLQIPVERYYQDIFHRRQHPPYSLYQLQLLIDTQRIDPKEPIDLNTLCKTNSYTIDPKDSQYGVHLTDEGIDMFKAKVNIEVQHASEQVIAAVERNGGVITTAFYDIMSVAALSNPLQLFKRGMPIPKRLLPPPDCIDYYSDPKNRGYLADPELVAEERFLLAQKYGYPLSDLSKDPEFKRLTLRKDPRQVFFGLEPGWVINLRDKEILKPSDQLLRKFYES